MLSWVYVLTFLVEVLPFCLAHCSGRICRSIEWDLSLNWHFFLSFCHLSSPFYFSCLSLQCFRPCIADLLKHSFQDRFLPAVALELPLVDRWVFNGSPFQSTIWQSFRSMMMSRNKARHTCPPPHRHCRYCPNILNTTTTTTTTTTATTTTTTITTAILVRLIQYPLSKFNHA